MEKGKKFKLKRLQGKNYGDFKENLQEDFIVSEVIPFMVKAHAESKVVKL